jgi:hypothetical protein
MVDIARLFAMYVVDVTIITTKGNAPILLKKILVIDKEYNR